MPARRNSSVDNPPVTIPADPGSDHNRPAIVLQQRDALKAQAVGAVVVFAGFYVLALVTVILLLLAPFFIIDTLGFFSPYLVLACYGVALLIVVAIVPRPDRFTPPGPALTSADQPRLFTVLAEVADRTGQPVPAEVYLVAGVNAFVAQRGGIMGLGSRRVMGVGLGAMQVLNLSEFKCVLAHEFGHFYDEHLKFGPWIYQARMAMVRAVQSLGEWNSWLYGPYKSYVLLFLRVTQKISRTQEFVADELAARLYGPHTTAGSLLRVHAGSEVFSSYWENEVAPRLRSGYRPSFLERFAYLVRQDRTTEANSYKPSSKMQVSNNGPYRSHPPLSERLGALADLALGEEHNEIDETPALSLLDNVDSLEELVFQHIYGGQRARVLRPITWEPVDGVMSLNDYEELVRRHSEALKGLTPLSLTRFACNIEAFGNMMVPTPGFLRPSDLDFVSFLATQTLSAALMLALRQAGWQVQLLSNENALCTRGEERLEPFRVIQHLATGHLNSDALRQRCLEAGIAEIDLRTVADRAQA